MIRIRNPDIIERRRKQAIIDEIYEKKEINIKILDNLKEKIYGSETIEELNMLKEEFKKLREEYELLTEQTIYYKQKNQEYENQINVSYNKIEEIEKELIKLKTPRKIIYGDKKKSIIKYNTPRKLPIID